MRPKFILKLGFGMGRVSAVAPVIITYLLRLIWADADDKVFSDTEVMDTEAEGRFDGSFTVVDTSDGSVEISSGQLVVNGATGFAGAGGYSQAITREAGRAVVFDMVTDVDNTLSENTILSFATAPDLSLASQLNSFLFLSDASGPINWYNGTVFPRMGTFAINTNYKCLIVLDVAGAFYYIKGGAYTDWTLIGIFGADTTATLYVNIQRQGLGRELRANEVLTPDTLYTDQITPGFTLVDETATDTFAEFFESGTFTAVTGQTLQFDYRRPDSQNSWRLKVAQGSVNNVTLHKVVASVESAALSTASVTISNGVSYSLKASAIGDDYHASWIDSVAATIYTTPDAHQETEDGMKLALGTIATVSLDIHQGTGQTFPGID